MPKDYLVLEKKEKKRLREKLYICQPLIYKGSRSLEFCSYSEHSSVWVICRNLPPHLDVISASQVLVRVYMVLLCADGRSGGNYIWKNQRQGCTDTPLGKSKACWKSFYLYECVSSHKNGIFYIDLW